MRKMVDYKRFGIATLTGAILGVACILGVGQRLFNGDYVNHIIYLMGIWAMRVLLGMIIGLAEGLVIIKGEKWNKWVNAGIRGIIFGLLFSATLILLDPYLDFGTFGAGIVYGPIIDLVATFFTRKRK
jgi:hypothetical protein